MYHVLLADDEARIRQGLRNIVNWEELGFTIVGETADGEETAAFLCREKPDVVLLDITMPKLSGLEVLQKEDLRLHRQHVTLTLDGEELGIPVDYHEFLRPQGAESWGVYQNAVSSDTTAISCRQVGKGRAIYVGIPMQEELLARLLGRCGVVSPFTPALPDGISAARLHDTATLYVNRTHLTKQIPVQGHALLGNQVKDGILTLPPYEADIIES